jgi:hypothetical protein
MLRWCIAALLCARHIRSLSGTGPVDRDSTLSLTVILRELEPTRSPRAAEGPPAGRVICVTIEQSYNRGCAIARWLRRSLVGPGPGRSKALATFILVLSGILNSSGPRAGLIGPGPDGTR